jgi:hypothetical protein
MNDHLGCYNFAGAMAAALACMIVFTYGRAIEQAPAARAKTPATNP